MWDLIKIVIPMIKAKWTHVAYSMQYDAEDIEGIEKDSSDSAESCERLFRNWLASSKGIIHSKNLGYTSEVYQRC